MGFDMIWLIAFYLLVIWFAITIGLAIRKMIRNSTLKAQSRVELEQLQKEELKKRIALLEKELAEKDKLISENKTEI